MADQMKDGLPRKAYAYAPSADPSTWKLPYLTATGAPDPDHLPGAAAALSAGGFRGQQADIPDAAMGAVKAKLRQGYKKWGKSPDEYPDSIREADAVTGEWDRTLREASEVPLDEGDHFYGAWEGGSASSGGHPGGPMANRAEAASKLYSGLEAKAAAKEGTPGYHEVAHIGALKISRKDAVPVSDIPPSTGQDAGQMLSAEERFARYGGKASDLTNSRPQSSRDDSNPYHHVSDSVLFMLADKGDAQAISEIADRGGYLTGLKEAMDVAVDVTLAEVGKRNSAADQGMIQGAHDALMKAGASCDMKNDPNWADDEGKEPDLPVSQVKESFSITDTESKPEDVRFHESSGGGDALVTLAEAGAEFDDAKHEVWITPIKPGFGNSRDKRYYPTDSVREAVDSGVFNGRKMYANHPTRREEGERPERDVRDWVGVIRETKWDHTRGVPRSRVQVIDDGVYAKWKAAPDQVAFSVLGKGKARAGRVGNRDAQIVESIAHINSIDWVTEAGAGGSIDFAEADYEEMEMADIAQMTPAQLREAAPDLYLAIREADDEDEQPKAGEPKEAAKTEAKADDAAAPKDEAKAEDAKVAESGFASREEFDALKRELAEMKVKEAAVEAKGRANALVTSMLSESDLPRPAREYIADRFRESAVGEGFGYADDDALGTEVEREIAGFRKVAEATGIRRPSLVRGLGAAGEADKPKSLRESMEGDIDRRMGHEDVPLREAKDTGTPAGAPATSKSSASAEASIASRMNA